MIEVENNSNHVRDIDISGPANNHVFESEYRLVKSHSNWDRDRVSRGKLRASRSGCGQAATDGHARG